MRQEWYPYVCSAAFIFECTKGRGRLVGAFPEHSRAANAYRGELMGLMAVHLILLSVNTILPDLQGSVHIYSDCLGALSCVAELPPERIPTRCKHSDILKTILVNCGKLSFERIYSHVKAHQDDHKKWHELDRPAQLNTACDSKAKSTNRSQDIINPSQQLPFHLEPVCLFVEREKMTSDTGPHIRHSVWGS